MILAFENDGTVTAYEDVGQVNSCCRAVDVERGIYTFTDQHGYVLAPLFDSSPRCRRWLGLFKWTAADAYRLEKTSQQRPDLLEAFLAGRIPVCLGPAALSDHEIEERIRPPAPVAK